MPELDTHVNDLTELLESLRTAFRVIKFTEKQVNLFAKSQSLLSNDVLQSWRVEIVQPFSSTCAPGLIVWIDDYEMLAIYLA